MCAGLYFLDHAVYRKVKIHELNTSLELIDSQLRW